MKSLPTKSTGFLMMRSFTQCSFIYIGSDSILATNVDANNQKLSLKPSPFLYPNHLFKYSHKITVFTGFDLSDYSQ